MNYSVFTNTFFMKVKTIRQIQKQQTACANHNVTYNTMFNIYNSLHHKREKCTLESDTDGNINMSDISLIPI